jgi:hypothetical protein
MVRAVCVLVILASSARAQHLSASDPAAALRADGEQRIVWATEWLNSNNPRELAWGAWVAKQDRAASLIPLLIEKVDAYRPGSERDRHDAMLSVLDALIEMRAPVAPVEARKLFPEFAAQSLILLVRSKDDATAELLDVFRTAQANWDWLAAGNVLAEKRTPGFAALLLAKFTQHLTIDVTDPNSGGNIGGGGSECGFSIAPPKRGWPPVGLFTLMQFPGRFPSMNATYLVGGEMPVYYYRAEPGNYDNPPDDAGYCDDGDRDRYREKYLNALIPNSQVYLEAYPYRSIIWSNENQYERDLIAIVEDYYAVFRRALHAMPEQVLTREESQSLKLRIEIVIRDDRRNPAAPLPKVPELNDSASVRPAFTKPLR